MHTFGLLILMLQSCICVRGHSQCYGYNSGFNISPGSNDITNLANTDLAGCCDFCAQTSACNGFVWNAVTKTCYLKSVAGPESVDASSIVGYPVVPTGQNVDQQCYGVNSGLNISPGLNDINVQTNMKLADCCNLCRETPVCKAFAWDESVLKCYLKSATLPQVIANNFVIGSPINIKSCTSQADCSPSDCLFENYCYLDAKVCECKGIFANIKASNCDLVTDPSDPCFSKCEDLWKTHIIPLPLTGGRLVYHCPKASASPVCQCL